METIKEKFFDTLGDEDSLNYYRKAYIILLLKAFFEFADKNTIGLNQVANYYKKFYFDRKKKGYQIEDNPDDKIRFIEDSSLEDIKKIIISNPLNTKTLEPFFSVENEDIVMNEKLWNSLTGDDISKIKYIINGQLSKYFEQRVDGDSMSIPDVNRKQIERAMEKFDHNLRNNDEWKNFTRMKNHYYVIEHNDKLYPVKKIISLATDSHLSTFSEEKAKKYITNKEFEIVELDQFKKPDKDKLLFKKKVDWSTFNWGITLPLVLHQQFHSHNRNDLQLGEAMSITLVTEDNKYNCDLRNVDRKTNNDSETLQIRYGQNKDLLNLLRREFSYSYNYIVKKRKKLKKEGNDRPHVKVPDDKAEYIEFYKSNKPFKYYLNFITKNEEKINKEPIEILNIVENYIKNKGFTYPSDLIKNYYLSLKTKPFVLLAGISGTGKTKLVELFAEAIGCTVENKRFELISVRPDWNDSSDLLGYQDLKNKFQPGPMIDIIKRVNEDPDNIYFACLDEMNLARVEYYFSEFLSKMETRKKIGDKVITDKLMTEKDFANDEDLKYADIIIPDNLYIIGTVNMDETTQPFSKKVLDRANTIEFSKIELENIPVTDEMNSSLKDSINNINNEFLKSEYVVLKDCLQDEKNQEIVKDVVAELKEINQILKPANLQVGYRVRDEICFYMIYALRDSIMEFNTVLDLQIMQKILPRIQGSSGILKEVLINLLTRASGKDYSTENGDIGTKAINYVENIEDIEMTYPRTAGKIALMIKRLETDGFTAYWI